MQRRNPSTIDYNVDLFESDMAAKGWMLTDIAREAALSNSTVGRFFSGKRRTPRVAKKIALALGYQVKRYIVMKQAMSA